MAKNIGPREPYNVGRAGDKKCERCFGMKPPNESYIYYQGLTVCERCANAMRAELRKVQPRDEEYARWFRKHKLKR